MNGHARFLLPGQRSCIDAGHRPSGASDCAGRRAGGRQGIDLEVFDDEVFLVFSTASAGIGPLLIAPDSSSKQNAISRVDAVETARDTSRFSALVTARAALLGAIAILALVLAVWIRDWTLMIFTAYFASLVIGAIYATGLVLLWSEGGLGFFSIEPIFYPTTNALNTAAFACMLRLTGSSTRWTWPLLVLAAVYACEIPLWI